MGVAETNGEELIEQADGVAGNSTGRRANALSLTQGFSLRMPKEVFGTPLSVAKGDPGAVTTRVSFLLEEHPMNDLLYRGHVYAEPTSTPKTCVEMTYRQEHYNTCRQVGSRPIDKIHLTYRGVPYIKHRG